MPRLSAEARSGAAWREGARHPEPPKHLSRAAKEIWREIVGIRPVDFFEPGSLHLLEVFCGHVVQIRRLAVLLDGEVAGSEEYERLVTQSTKLGANVATLAQKLRLSIQSALRVESGKNDERTPAAGKLLGGTARLN